MKGNALLSALFIMTLVAIVATAISMRLQLDIGKTNEVLKSNRLFDATKVVNFWAISQLSDINQNFNKANDNGKIRDFPQTLQNAFEKVQLKGELIDLHSRLNLNSLGVKPFQPIFLNLLNTVEDLPEKEKKEISLSAREWIRPSLSPVEKALLEQYYSHQTPPYHESGEPMLDVSEFRLLAGVNLKIYRALIPYITALPEVTFINLDTASPTLIKAIFGKLSSSEEQEIFLAQKEKSKAGQEKLLALLDAHQIPRELVTFESQYFLVVAVAYSEGDEMRTTTLIKREVKNGKVKVRVLNRSINEP